VRKDEGREHSKDIGVDRRITLKFILKLEKKGDIYGHV
jgi:hypothetical protein